MLKRRPDSACFEDSRHATPARCQPPPRGPRRTRDLYELGDLERYEYIVRRNAINALLDERRVVTVQPKPSSLPFFEKDKQQARAAHS